MDNDGTNDFKKGQTDVFEYDLSEVHINPHCFENIKEILFTDGTCMGGNNCNAWKAESIDFSIKNVAFCETTTIDIDVRYNFYISTMIKSTYVCSLRILQVIFE